MLCIAESTVSLLISCQPFLNLCKPVQLLWAVVTWILFNPKVFGTSDLVHVAPRVQFEVWKKAAKPLKQFSIAFGFATNLESIPEMLECICVHQFSLLSTGYGLLRGAREQAKHRHHWGITLG